MDTLPNEVLALFFVRLDIRSLASATLVCYRWHALIESNEWLWSEHRRYVLERKGVLALPYKFPSTGEEEREKLRKLIRKEDQDHGADTTSTQVVELKNELPEENVGQQRLRRLIGETVREEMRTLASANKTSAERVTIVVDGSTPHYRWAIVKALDRELGGKGGINPPTDVTVAYNGLLSQLEFRSVEDMAWLRSRDPPVSLGDHIFVFCFLLDDEDEGKSSLAFIDQLLPKTRRLQFYPEIPTTLLGLKKTDFLDASLHDVENEVAASSHFLCEKVEDLPFKPKRLPATTPKATSNPEKNKRKKGNYEEGKEEELESLLEGDHDEEDEDDVELGLHAAGKEKEKENEKEEEKEQEKIEEPTQEDKVRKEAILLAHRMPYCNRYIEVGWSPTHVELDQPLPLIAALLESLQRAKERTWTPTMYAVGRQRLEDRQYHGRRYVLYHILEGVLCVLAVPLVELITGVLLILFGLYYLGALTTSLLLPGYSNNNNPYLLRVVLWVFALPAMLVIDAVALFALAAGMVLSPLFLAPLAFSNGYNYGVWETTRMTLPLTLTITRRLHAYHQALIDSLNDPTQGLCNSTVVSYVGPPYAVGFILLLASLLLFVALPAMVHFFASL